MNGKKMLFNVAQSCSIKITGAKTCLKLEHLARSADNETNGKGGGGEGVFVAEVVAEIRGDKKRSMNEFA